MSLLASIGQSAVAVILTLLILSVLVVVHEFGHFLTARIAGIRVHEFGIGFPPRAKVLGNDGETEYTVNWLPIGGFVKLEGEDADSDDPRSFSRAGLGKQLTVLVAGVTMNLLTALVLFFVVALFFNSAVGVKISELVAGGAAQHAGLQVGDTVESVNGQLYANSSSQSILDGIRGRAGQTVDLGIIKTNGSHETVRLTLGSDPNAGVLGITRGSKGWEFALLDENVPTSPVQAAGEATARTGQALVLILQGLQQLGSQLVSNPSQAPQGVGGPVAITEQVGTVFFNYGPIMLLTLAAILSANLALVNILPFPPLDGGRMLVLVVKRLLGTRGVSQFEALTYAVGFALLIAFIAWLSFFDVTRLGQSTP